MTRVPVTRDRCAHIAGPFFHGTKAALEAGDELVRGYGSNYGDGRVSNHIYFAALVEPAVWGAEPATALAGNGERGHVYVLLLDVVVSASSVFWGRAAPCSRTDPRPGGDSSRRGDCCPGPPDPVR